MTPAIDERMSVAQLWDVTGHLTEAQAIKFLTLVLPAIAEPRQRKIIERYLTSVSVPAEKRVVLS